MIKYSYNDIIKYKNSVVTDTEFENFAIIKKKIIESDQYKFRAKYVNKTHNETYNIVMGILNKITKLNYDDVVNDLNIVINSDMELRKISSLFIDIAMHHKVKNLCSQCEGISLISDLIKHIITCKYLWNHNNKTFRIYILEELYCRLHDNKVSTEFFGLIGYLYTRNILSLHHINEIKNIKNNIDGVVYMLYIIKTHEENKKNKNIESIQFFKNELLNIKCHNVQLRLNLIIDIMLGI